MATALATTLLAGSVNGADMKIGVVNFKKCVETSKVGKKEQQNFEAQKKQMDDVLSDKEKTLNEISAKLSDSDYMDSLTPEADAELKHKFRTLSAEFQQLQNQYYQVLNQTNYKVIQKIQSDISDASKMVAQDKKLDAILNQEMFFYNTEALDVSDDIVNVMDKNYKDTQ